MNGPHDHARAKIAQAVQSRMLSRSTSKLDFDDAGSEALGAWFLGPKAENEKLLLELVARAIAAHAESRRRYYPGDPVWLTDERKKSPAFTAAIQTLERELDGLLGELDASVPFYSYRYQGHMLWDVTLPAVLGYVAALLYNQNNVAAEASPVTTWLEMLVGDDLCRMLGLYIPKRNTETGAYEEPEPGKTTAWGHVTCDGSVANIEALWAARNAKYYPLGLATALTREEALAPARGLTVKLPNGRVRPLIELDTWQLLNLEADVVLALPARIKSEYDCGPDTNVDAILAGYTVQEVGLGPFLRRYAPHAHDPVILAPATAHYSWPKGAGLIGLGKSSVLSIPVDLDARLDLRALRTTLDKCLRERRPVIMLVAVLGTTEESAIDPLAAIVAERERYRALGLELWLHVDAAWGGYFASMLRPGPPSAFADSAKDDPNLVLYGPDIVMSEYVNAQYLALEHADSITVDPHKAGYVPYPAGSLCYRNAQMRDLVTFKAPVVFHGAVDPTVGVFGIEGSKPGAAPAAVYLSHRVIRPDASGYGRILGRCMWNSKRLYCGLLTMAKPNDPFKVVALQRLASERVPGATPEAVAVELAKIRSTVVARSNEALIAALNQDAKLLSWFRELGSDQVILSYAFNFKGHHGLNEDIDLMNRLNDRIFERLSVLSRHADLPNVPLFLTSSALDPKVYGTTLVSDFKRRLGVSDASATPVHFLISTTMNPWLSDTEDGDFTPTLIDELRTTVLKIIGEGVDRG